MKVKGFFVWVDLIRFVHKCKVMEATTIRQKLIIYLTDANEDKVNAMYTLLKEEIEREATFYLTEEHYDILAEEEAKYLRGEGKSYTREEANQIAKGLRDF